MKRVRKPCQNKNQSRKEDWKEGRQKLNRKKVAEAKKMQGGWGWWCLVLILKRIVFFPLSEWWRLFQNLVRVWICTSSCFLILALAGKLCSCFHGYISFYLWPCLFLYFKNTFEKNWIFYFIFYLLQINMFFFVFLDHFNTLILKIIF